MALSNSFQAGEFIQSQLFLYHGPVSLAHLDCFMLLHWGKAILNPEHFSHGKDSPVPNTLWLEAWRLVLRKRECGQESLKLGCQ